MVTKKKENLTPEAETIQTLAALLERANTSKPVEVASTGACLISTPGSPRPTCAMLTPQQCADLRGTYVGGKCPS